MRSHLSKPFVGYCPSHRFDYFICRQRYLLNYAADCFRNGPRITGLHVVVNTVLMAREPLSYHSGTIAFDVLPAKNDGSLWRVTTRRASYDTVLLAERRTIACSPCTQPLIFLNLVPTPVASIGNGCASSFCGYQSEMIQALNVARSFYSTIGISN
jgi:hypothetical protein